MRPGDWLVLILLCGLTGWMFRQLWLPPEPALEVRISSADTRQLVSLQTDSELSVGGPLGTSVLEVRDGAVRFRSSPCRHQLCVRSGWHRRSGAVAACVPNRVSILLLGGQSEFDGLSY